MTKQIIFWILPLFLSIQLQSQKSDMTIEKMDEIIHSVGDSVINTGGQWQLEYQKRFMLIFSDTKYNRMRIISPVIDQKFIDHELLVQVMEANFHSALDVKYALSDEVLWSIFVHPLRELTENQLVNAINQVFNAVENFGTSFSSTGLVFPGTAQEKKDNSRKNN